jgi:hypothetical protein
MAGLRHKARHKISEREKLRGGHKIGHSSPTWFIVSFTQRLSQHCGEAESSGRDHTSQNADRKSRRAWGFQSYPPSTVGVTAPGLSSSVHRDPDAPHIERTLELNLRQHPEDARGIEKVLGFRKRVREEFDRLVRESEKAAPESVSSAN